MHDSPKVVGQGLQNSTANRLDDDGILRPDGLAAHGSSFADRIKLLIQQVGSATEIARRCGFSEGVVRSWRDGNTDPSRARCVTLARTLGISLVWLVAGEGNLHAEALVPGPEDQRSSALDLPRTPGPARHDGMDPQRLHVAMRILQSQLNLVDSRLRPADHTDLLSELYGIVGPGGSQVDALAMAGFNQRLAARLRRSPA